MGKNFVEHNAKKVDISDSYKSFLEYEDGQDQSVNCLAESPFLMENDSKYKIWKKEKLSGYPVDFDNFIVNIENLDRITAEERLAIKDRYNKYNMALYQLPHAQCDPESLKIFARNFGLENLDLHYCNDNNGITALRVSNENNKGGFIPYSDKAINWHTDGYYNSVDQQVHGLLLHCDTPASEGGVSQLMDHEMAYICLRDENPAYIEALMHENAMTIPAHIENGVELRPQRSGPVFLIFQEGKRVHMRYTQRKKHIIWRDDPVTKEAVAFLDALLTGDNPYVLQLKLNTGQGLICNNVLHNRSAFKDSKDQLRILYRGRYFESLN